MAPTSADVESCANGQKSKSVLRQLRKPAVEKLRRDRINRSIKQLRTLLEREFQSHQPSSKLEKADILEMTVNFLKQRHLLVNASRSRSDVDRPSDVGSIDITSSFKTLRVNI